VTIHANAGFTEIRSSFDALAENKGRSFEIKETEHPSFLSGRSGAIISNGTEVGVIGELNPRVTKSWGLNLPAAGFELEMSALSLT
jgi:phenylalanyl-tRNA synthetase beta chain